MSPPFDITLSTDVLNYWDLKHDPFSITPLDFEDYSDFDLLVKTSAIKVANDVIKQIENMNGKRIWLVEGYRGSGKSTVMRYIKKRLNKNNILPIYANIQDLNDSNLEAIKLSVQKELLSSMIEQLNDSIYVYKDEISNANQAITDNNLAGINLHIRYVKKLLNKKIGRVAYFIDNLDKSDPKKFILYEEYFRKSQGFFEDLLRKPRAEIFIAMPPYMISNFILNREIGYLGDKKVVIKPWTHDELTELLEKRLKPQYKYPKSEFKLTKFFHRNVLSDIFHTNNYMPRWIMIASSQLLQKAHEVTVDNRFPILTKPITRVFTNTFREEVSGVRGPKKEPKFYIIIQKVLQNHLQAWNRIKNMLHNNHTLIYELADGLMKIWISGDTDNKIVITILSDSNIISKSNSNKSKYIVDKTISNLLKYLYYSMELDSDFVVYFLFKTNI